MVNSDELIDPSDTFFYRINLEDDDVAWITYEEYSAIKAYVDDAVEEGADIH